MSRSPGVAVRTCEGGPGQYHARVSDEPRAGRKQATQSGAGPSDTALVVAARGGEAWAQEALYRRYARMVNGLAWRLMPGDADVEDLVQDVFVQALGSLDRLTEPAAFSSWLGAITVRTAHKRIRRKRLHMRLGLVRREAVDLDAVIAPSAPPDVQSELKAIYRVLEDLPAEERIALVLRRVEGMPLAEIADQMKLSLATVKRRLEAAESKLRAHGAGDAS